MNNDLDTLKVACAVLSDLKQSEREFNRTLVKAASYGLLKLQHIEPMTKEAWIGKAITLGAGLAAGAYAAGHANKWGNAFMRGMNHLNSNWGRNAVMEYANRGEMTPEQRDTYLKMRFGASPNYQQYRQEADARLQANRDASYRQYRNMDASYRGQRMMNTAQNSAGMAYSAGRAGRSGMGYGSGFQNYGPGGSYGGYGFR